MIADRGMLHASSDCDEFIFLAPASLGTGPNSYETFCSIGIKVNPSCSACRRRKRSFLAWLAEAILVKGGIQVAKEKSACPH